MSRSTHREQLSIASLKLKNAAPEEWDKFKQAFDHYTIVAAENVVEADFGGIMVAKGAALQCRELRIVFAECERVKDKA
jgi:hypothetical protein